MTIDLLLQEARRCGIRLWIEAGRLRYEAPKGADIEPILVQLREHKAQLLQRLQDPDAVTAHPVSFGQRALWFEYQLNPASTAYNYAFSATIRSDLDVPALQRAFQAIVDRHAILRTTYGLESGRPVQRVHDYQVVAFKAIDASAWPASKVQETVRASAHRPFDLEKGPVFRVELYTCSAREHLLLLNAHHIAMDFRSLAVLIEELGHLYAVQCGLSRPALPAVRTQFADFARWQTEMAAGPEGDKHWRFWNERLAPTVPLLCLPTDRPRPAVRTYSGSSLAFDIGPELCRQLKALARAQRVTLYTLLVAAFQALLHRYSGQEEFLMGSPMLGRTRPEFQRVLGYCINPVVLRADFAGDPAFGEYLRQTHAQVLAAMEHHDYPFPLLVQRLQPARDASRSPLFDVMFNLNVAQVEGDAEQGLRMAGADNQALALEAQPQAQGEGQFDLILQIFDSGASLSGTLEYNTDLFNAAAIRRMADHFRVLLASIVADPACRVSALAMLTAAERRELRLDGATPAARFPVPAVLHELFEQQAARSPDSLAVTFEGRSLTYRELNERANQLAWRLRGMGVGPEVLVSICVERSLEMIIGLLGILKAGGAYVPLDPAYPKDRLAHMLADSHTPVLLTQESLLGHLPDAGTHVLCLDRDWPAIARESNANPPRSAAPANAAYVIYTSGSTGRPKGVVVCHEHVVRLFTATEHWFHFDGRDVWTLFHSYAFDFSVWELWGALLYGGRLVVVPYLVSRSPEAFCRLLSDEGVTVLNQTPSAFRQLIAAEAQQPLPTGSPLRYVIFGGEALDLRSLLPWYQRHGDRQPVLVNMYGITETTVHVTYRPLSLADVEAGRGSMIGEPIPDLELYLLDSRGEPVPVGVPGELYVGGAGLARGYLNQPALTAERFITYPFGGRPGTRLYRTGDLVRRREGGDIEYLGRVDQQVKIRGFRIEIGEIEAVLKQCPGVADAIVMASGEVTAEKRLVGYVRTAAETRTTVDELRHHAREKLPDYMVPATFVFLDAFPLTPSGKVDRKALPAAGAARPELESAFAAPTTTAEEALAQVWSEVLGLERVGIDDNFFSLGGDSILSIRVVAAAGQRGLKITLADVFQYQTIRELGASADGVPATASQDPDRTDRVASFALLSAADAGRMPADVEDAYPLARLQAGMLFHAQLNPDLAVYSNLSSLHLRLPFDAGRLRAAIDHVVSRHPVLRTSFDLTRWSEPLQLVHRHVQVPLTVDDTRHMAAGEQQGYLREWIERERAKDFDTGKPPLLRFHVHRRADDRVQLTWAEHHAILDGWSVATMLTEVVSEYMRLLGHHVQAESPAPVAGFADFVALERQTAASEEHRSFWTRQMAGASATRLPRWRRDSSVDARCRFGQHSVAISAEVSQRLQDLARQLGVPVKSVLLAAHLKVLSAWTGRREVLTGLIANGRPETAASERTLGLFLNTVPLRMSLEPAAWNDLVHQAHQGELQVLPHRRYPLAEIQRAIGTQDLIETSFNFIHFHVYQGLASLGPIEVLDTTAFERTNFTMMATFSLDPLAARPEVGLTLHYDAAELSCEQIEALAASYRLALESLALTPAGRHESSSLLPPDHRDRVLVAFNQTSVARQPAVCLHQLFEAQAAGTPDAIALVCGRQSLSYRDLDVRSNRLARYLREQGVGPEGLVGVCMERSVDLVVALLAVLKAGAAYVPLDGTYPAERLKFILQDSRAAVLLTTGNLVDRLADCSSRVICLDRERPALEAIPASRLDDAGVRAGNLAYVIYTSGSTGRPQGRRHRTRQRR